MKFNDILMAIDNNTMIRVRINEREDTVPC